MPIRIYALAKQLKIDNSTLVDICAKAGITGKGSALAGLTDEEVAKVTAFMETMKGARSGAARGARAAGARGAPGTGAAFRREDYIASGGAGLGKVPVLPGKPAEKPAPPKKKPPEEAPTEKLKPVEPALEPPPGPAEELERPVIAELVPEAPQEVPQEIAEPAERPKPGEVEAAIEKEDKEKEKERLKDREKEKEKEKPREEKPPRERAGPTIKLAPVPAAQKPPRKERPKEPTPQKPDLKLPLDAIRAGKAGAKPLAEHIRKHEERRAAEAKKKGPPTPAGAPSPGAPAPTREHPRRPGRVGPPAPEGEPVTLGGREQRQLKRKRAAATRPRSQEEETDAQAPARRRTHIKRTGTNTAAPRKGKISLHLPCTVREFSEALGVPAKVILAKLLELGGMANIAAALEAEMAELLAVELGAEVELHRPVALEEQLLSAMQSQQDDPALLKPRPPVITFLGHVDHGKTSLLDRILGLDVAAHEKGGITQHIRAYRIDKDGRPIAFVDTPGHEAFTAMRARGANVTDIAVLVVAADDGVMPQTEEAISHARAAGVPIVVALNKIDLPGVNTERVYRQLADNDLLPAEWGGQTEVVKTSAVTGAGIDLLLETLLTVAELHEYHANPDRPAVGTCLEAQLHEGRGVMGKLLVQNGTLRVGQVIVCGATYGRVKAMYDTLDARKKYREAGPSTPVDATGLNIPPAAGDRFYVLESITQARHLAESRAAESRQQALSGGRPHVTLENLFERLGQQDQVQTLNIILRADVRGSIEAIRKELTKLQHPEVQIRILQATVGGVTEADVHLADASDAVILAFNVVPDEGARLLADRLGVQVRRYDIIYQVTEDVRAALEGMLKPEQFERDLGRALVQRTFQISRVGTVAGCRVLSGVIARDARIRVIRDSRIIGEYPVDSLKREKNDAREVREGLECGVKLAGFNDVKEGDLLEAYKIEEVRRTLEDAVAN